MLEFHSPLSPTECAAALWAASDPPWALFGRKRVLGLVLNRRFRGRQRISYRNTMQTVMTARILPDGSGSRVVARFGPSLFMHAFLVFWFGFLIIGCIPILGVVSGSVEVLRGSWLPLLMPPLLGAFGLAFYWFGRSLARNEEAFLAQFLTDTLSPI